MRVNSTFYYQGKDGINFALIQSLHIEGLVGLEEQQDGGHEEKVGCGQRVPRQGAREEVDEDGSDDGNELEPDAPPVREAGHRSEPERYLIDLGRIAYQ